MAKTNIESVKVKHIESGKIHFFNFGTWSHHRRVEKASGKKIYQMMRTIPAGRSNNRAQSRGIKEQEMPQIQSRSLGQDTPPPPKKKKRCNC